MTREKLQLLAEDPRSPRRYDFSDDFPIMGFSRMPFTPLIPKVGPWLGVNSLETKDGQFWHVPKLQRSLVIAGNGI